MKGVRSTVACLAALACVALPVTAGASPTNPYLHVSPATAKRALDCTPGWRHAEGEPVLLVHGTATTAEVSWGSGYMVALPNEGLGACTITLPRRSLGDIQHSSEYVVRAVAHMARRSGEQVDIIGHSQGTLQPRWAVKWWRSARRHTDDIVQLASPNHGTASASGMCLTGNCPAAVWQMSFGSGFIEALNSGDESPDGVQFTSIFSRFDDLVQPAGTAKLAGASNIDIQELCPARPVHHGSIIFDAVAYWAALNALEFDPDGSRDLFTGSGPPCSEAFIPGIDPVDDAILGDLLLYADALPALVQEGEFVGSEPPLRSYASRPSF